MSHEPKSVDSGSPKAPPPGDLFQDPELEGKTLYEKKCVLINREIDSNGMARYQWYIWFLCGFGYFIDLLWAQAFGLVLGPLRQELGFGGDQSGNISASFSAGLTAGAFVWGVLVDIVGRQWSFNLTCLISAAFGLGLGGTNSYNAFLIVTAFVGFGIGGNIPIDTTICLEFIPQNRRFLLALLSIFQPIGVVICSAFAYAYIPTYSCTPNFSESDPLPSCNLDPNVPCCARADNMGWRYLMFTLGALTLAVFFLRFVVFRFKESPKFLVYRGRDEEAIGVMQYIAKFNKRDCTVSIEHFEALTSDHNSLNSGTELLGTGAKQLQLSFASKLKLEFARYGLLFKGWPMTRLTILVWLTYICDYWGFTLAGTYLPVVLAIKNGAIDVPLRQTYRSYVYIYLPGIIGVVGGAMMYRVPAFGRKWTMVIASGLMGASIFIYSTVNDEASNIGLNVMEYFFQSMFNAVLYGWTPEVFPAPVRGTACGVASFWGRLFGIIAPLTAQSLIPTAGLAAGDQSINRILYLAGGITLGCVLTTSLLPNNKRLAQQSM
ncbi:major facilitator superfamily domain-containing protein [Elsinoe ampelina]|uniref:Major facilitator superfamily domain-containing protein n=1 Tax=Elsinoe ampelina TaxID=302913 RepID=A0A6A6GC13_9PEZI|nr:major facilitator superfamily domain-containing protein [Elsinoe ampelina]